MPVLSVRGKRLRSRVGALAALAALAAAGCGSAGTSSNPDTKGPARAAKSPEPVPFKITSNGDWDTVHKSQVVLRGIAAHGASLEIQGEPVTVNQAGNWRKTVKLTMGDNSFGFQASMPGAKSVDETLNLTRKRSAAELAAWRE